MKCSSCRDLAIAHPIEADTDATRVLEESPRERPSGWFACDAVEPGTRLGDWEILCPIGRGGMATVWLARLPGTEELVALKTVKPEHADDPSFREMLRDEARIGLRIEHPNVPRVLAVEEDEEVPFLVLEYVAGHSLHTLHRELQIRGERVPAGVALRVLADACAGLHAAHELVGAGGAPLGLVHRDISPQNVLVDPHGVAKVIDFGIAKVTGRLSHDTDAGVVKGKVAYMAPEQALDGEVDRRTDVWSVGALLYYLVNGRYPFDAGTDAARLLRAVSGEAPDPFEADVPDPVVEVVTRCLSAEPRSRYGSTLALKSALEEAAASSACVATTSDVADFLAGALAVVARARAVCIDRARARINRPRGRTIVAL